MDQVYTFTRSLRAETIKLKRTPILWLAIIGGIFVSIFTFLIHLFKVQDFTATLKDPWILYLDLGFLMISMLAVVPYAVLLSSAVTATEHGASSWKYLYTLPLKRGNIFFSKLLVVVLLLLMTFFIYFISILLSAYLLDCIYPQYQFRNYSPGIGDLAIKLTHCFISVLGIVSVHFWLSIRWDSFIKPIGIGLLGFIVAMFLVMFSGRFDLAAYFPYAYPLLIGRAFGPEPISLGYFGWFSKIEVYSLALFVIFGLVGFYEEKLRNVK